MDSMKLYTPDEAAKILRITRRSVYNYIKAGQLKAAKMGREWRITEEHLIEFANTGTENNYLQKLKG
jgi:excisionase family DNA binding protein